MNKIKIFLFFLVLSLAVATVAASTQEFPKKLHTENDLLYDEAGPFTGTYKIEEDGFLISSSQYVDGKQHGYSVEYFPRSKKIKNEAEYSLGKLEYLKVFYPSGATKYECSFIEGKPDGFSKSYYLSGKTKTYIEYVGGLKNGVDIKYSEDGEILEFHMFKDGALVGGDEIEN